MLKAIAATLIGIEEVAVKELKEFGCKSLKKVADGRILFTINEKKLSKLSNTKSVNAVYTLLDYFKFTDEKAIYERIKHIKFSLKGTFVVRCRHTGEVSSKDVERNVGEIIFNHGHKVNLQNPDNTVLIDIVKNKCFIGLKLFDGLCKRKYRIKVNNQGINACLAYALLRISGYTTNKILVDPFCKDGVIVVEAVLFKKGKVYGIDRSTGNIKASRINAKLARVFDKISLENSNISWLDTKFKKGEVDLIITSPPFISNKMDKQDIEFINREYKELFYQAKYVLNKKGKMLLLCQKGELLQAYANDYKFKLLEERKIYSGAMQYTLLIYK